jgi:TatD DNase family protein
MGILAVSNACTPDEFSHNEVLAVDNSDTAPLLQCFGIHPQFFKIMNDESGKTTPPSQQQEICNNYLETLDTLASNGKIAAVGECGFDLFNSAFKETEAFQERFFSAQLEIALRFDLPVILHARRAIHKIFSYAKPLSKCKAVIFHSWPGTPEEAKSILRRSINAYFSFGNIIMLNHKQAMHSCAILPVERLLTETDAPFQPRRGEKFSHYADLPFILQAVAALRSDAGNNITANDLEIQIETNFRRALCYRVFGNYPETSS